MSYFSLFESFFPTRQIIFHSQFLNDDNEMRKIIIFFIKFAPVLSNNNYDDNINYFFNYSIYDINNFNDNYVMMVVVIILMI